MTVPRGVHVIAEEQLYGRGFRYEDLVRAVDVVITKPGYGIIADCIANDAAMLYTSRGRFAEYEVMVARDAAVPAVSVISSSRGFEAGALECRPRNAGGICRRHPNGFRPTAPEVAARLIADLVSAP